MDCNLRDVDPLALAGSQRQIQVVNKELNMNKTASGVAKRRTDFTELSYHSLKNISSPEDLQNDRKVYAGSIRGDQVLSLSTDQNVREYLVDAIGKKNRRKTDVHRKIEDTLNERPENFPVLNSGLVIVARHAEIDDAKKIVRLQEPSIVNGAQTQGTLRDFFKKFQDKGADLPVVHTKFELIVTDDEDLIAEISIARNFQNDVMTVSIVGRLGMFEEIEEQFQLYENTAPGMKLRKKETDRAEDFVRTERMVQVLTALTPASLWMRKFDNGVPTKAYTYSAQSKCLKEYRDIYTLAKTESPADEPAEKRDERERAKAVYQFFLDIVGPAWELYHKWKSHPEFGKTYLKNLDREDLPDGLIFPILASLSVFAEKDNKGKWRLDVPESVEQQLVQAAKQVYMNLAGSSPIMMGRTQACYALLNMIAVNLKSMSKN
jgi:AIPR protein